MRKVVWLLISTGVAELVLFALSVIFNTPLPLTPVQLLWLNLVTNGIQDVALAFEKGEPGVLKRKPRDPDERIFNRLMIEEVLISGLYMGIVGFVVFWMLTAEMNYETFDARNLLLLLLVLFENVHAFNVRSETRSAFRIPLSANWLLVGAIGVSQGVHIVSMFIPGWRGVLEIEPVAFTTWVILLAITLSKFLVVEAYKTFRGRALAESIHQQPSRPGRRGKSADGGDGDKDQPRTADHAKTADFAERARHAEFAETAERANKVEPSEKKGRWQRTKAQAGPPEDRARRRAGRRQTGHPPAKQGPAKQGQARPEKARQGARMMNNDAVHVRDLADLGRRDGALVGGKNASLGEMIRCLHAVGVRVPSGFATTADAYWHFIDHNDLRQTLSDDMAKLKDDRSNLSKVGDAVRGHILGGDMPGPVAEAIRQAYRDLAARLEREDPDVAVRSSATAEDLPEASFAGQLETFLNIRGEKGVVGFRQALLRLALYRSRHRLPRGKRLRPHEHSSVGRGAADGAI